MNHKLNEKWSLKSIYCSFFERCSAPICPLDPDYKERIWYQNEEICQNREFKKLQFIKTQKRIRKYSKKFDISGVFTFSMLDRRIKIGKGFQGINDELNFKSFKSSESAWIKHHKGIDDKLKVELLNKLTNSSKIKNER